MQSFRCTTGSWSLPITLVIGPRQGISYTTDGAITATHMTEFSHVQSIQTVETASEKNGTYNKGKYIFHKNKYKASKSLYELNYRTTTVTCCGI